MALLDGTNAPSITVEFDYGWRTYFTLGISLLNGPDVLGTSPTTNNWQAIPTTDVRSISIRRGRTREDQNNQPGQLSLVIDNRSGNYDPDNASSTYQWYGYSILMRGMAVRVSATYSGTTYVQYLGFIEHIDVDNSLDPIVTFVCTDSLAILGARQLASIPSSYSGDTTVTRIGRILDNVAFPTPSRTLSGSRQMQPTTFGSTALVLCEEAARCEFGRFHVDRQGNVVLIPYENLKTTTNRFTLSDTRSAGTIEYDDIHTTPGAYFLVNQCVLTQAVGISQTADVAYSEMRFGTYTRNVSAPLLDNAVAATMAGYYASRTAYPSTRVDRIGFDALGVSSTWTNILQTDLGDKVSVARTTVDGRSLSYTCLIESWNQDITPNSWRISLDLSPATF
jgi:hypothetical protein